MPFIRREGQGLLLKNMDLKWIPQDNRDGIFNSCHDFAVNIFNFIANLEPSTVKSDTLCGEKWKPRWFSSSGGCVKKFAIHYIPISKYFIDSDQLSVELEKLIDFKTRIVNVLGYWTPLSEAQLTAALLYHRYIVFKTEDGYWWSIEKNDEGLTMQRGKSLEDVRDNYRQELRLKGSYWKP